MNKRLIGVDARMARRAGIGRYTQELLKHLALGGNAPDMIFVYKEDKELFSGAEFASSRLVTVKSPIYSLWEQAEMARCAKPLDLLHTPHLNVPLLRKGAQVCTVHDLIYLTYKPYLKSPLRAFYIRRLMEAVVRKKSHIITVSDYSKQVLLRYFPKLKAHRVTVSYEAAADIFKPVSDEALLRQTRAELKLENPFILFVGSFKPHKNIPTLIEAVRRLRAKHRLPHELVLVGGEHAGENESFIRCLGKLPDETLMRLYNLADVFVLPSFEEGFGLPLLEAMQCGTPSVYAAGSSLSEIGQQAGLSFDPLRADAVDALTAVLYNVLKDKHLRTKMSQNGPERARFFSWQKTAQITRNLYQRALNEGCPVS